MGKMLLVFCLLCILFLLPEATDSQLVSCYYEFDRDTGSCHGLIGNVTQDECCLSYYYGFRDESGECKSCRKASWSAWSPWSPCSVSCLKGVKQRRRRCDGIGECQDPKSKDKAKTQTQQITVCEDQDCCPEQGGWAEWGEWQPCSVTCEKGTTVRHRNCSNPAPICGGLCDGLSLEAKPCETKVVCPTHGGWSEWGPWGPCSGTCRKEGSVPPSQQRWRSCTNPPPSSDPAGRPCPGDESESQDCDFLVMCAIDGNWGRWGPLSECSVTCGVGQEFRSRSCDSPAPKYGGRPCVGDSSASEVCKTHKPCPVHGEWEEWGEWGPCDKTTYSRPISCTKKTGSQSRRRVCFRDFDGAPCEGSIVEHRHCYDLTDTKDRPCKKPGQYTEWGEWGFCEPHQGALKRIRERVCVHTLPEFEINRGIPVYYSGKADVSCKPVPQRKQMENCPEAPDEFKDLGSN